MAVSPGSFLHPGLKVLTGRLGEAVWDRSSVRRFAAGEVVVAEGLPVRDLMVVQDGRLSATVDGAPGRVIELATYGPGDVFGEMSFLAGAPASATVRATAAGSLLEIPHAVLAEAMVTTPAIAAELGQLVAGRLAQNNRKLGRQPHGRVAWLRCGPGLAAIAGVALARSCAFHLSRPVAVLAAAESIPSETPQSATTSPSLFWVPLAPGCDAAGLAQDLAARYELVLVFAPPPGGAEAVALDIVEGHEPRHVSAPHVALVRVAGATAAELAAVGSAKGVTIVGTIPRDQLAAADLSAPLTREASLDEPWRSIGRVARWVTGQQVGLALGAGAAKGFAHIGVLAALEQRRVPIDYVAGSSVGSAVAAGVALGRTPAFIRRELDESFRRASRPRLPYSALLSNKAFHRYLLEMTEEATFDAASIPLAIVAVDADSREEVVIRDGRIADAIIASCAIPGVYPPVHLAGRRLVDGGLLNPVPISTASGLGADTVLGVRLTGSPRQRRRRSGRLNPFGAPPIVDNVLEAIEIMMNKISADGATHADVLIQPFFDVPSGIKDYRDSDRFVEAGHAAVAAADARLKEQLPWIQ